MTKKKLNKLNTLLAKSEALAPSYKGLVADYMKFFKGSQGAFTGEKKTYEPLPDTVDEPNRRGNRLVQTTVNEKWDYFTTIANDYFDTVMSIEKSNAEGLAKAELVVDGNSWGEFTTLELLRLKSIVENGELLKMLENTPVRSDSEEWSSTSSEMYQDREVSESPVISGTNRTTEKESYILQDPNIGKLQDQSSYTPQVAQKTKSVELGKYTVQKFSGEWSQRQKAAMLLRRTQLLTSIAEALKEANDVDAVSSGLSGEKVFGFLFGES